MQDGILLFDADGSIRACNASAEQMFGLTANQIVGRSARDPRWRTIHEDGAPFPAEEYPVTVTLRTGTPCVNIIMGVHKPDDTVTWIAINSQPLFRANEVVPYAVVTNCTDITQRKQLEEELSRATTELAEINQRL